MLRCSKCDEMVAAEFSTNQSADYVDSGIFSHSGEGARPSGYKYEGFRVRKVGLQSDFIR